jgi:N-acetylmuramoyl-L-alanine amidase
MVITIRYEKIITFFLIIIIAVSGYITYSEKVVTTFSLPIAKRVIVIDAGHGGFDPGKVGTKGQDEKDINLKISEKLQEYLEQSGSYVIITRADDKAAASTKNDDMRQRRVITNTSQADILVSIHQNSFPQMGVKGAQAFYHNSSVEGKYLAECIQKAIKEVADPTNKRVAKANTDYYVLRTTEIPAVIVECGFLSNKEEEQKLNTKEYQEKIAWSIYVGIIDYFENLDSLKAGKI